MPVQRKLNNQIIVLHKTLSRGVIHRQGGQKVHINHAPSLWEWQFATPQHVLDHCLAILLFYVQFSSS
jgi:hypothetical protein